MQEFSISLFPSISTGVAQACHSCDTLGLATRVIRLWSQMTQSKPPYQERTESAATTDQLMLEHPVHESPSPQHGRYVRTATNPPTADHRPGQSKGGVSAAGETRRLKTRREPGGTAHRLSGAASSSSDKRGSSSAAPEAEEAPRCPGLLPHAARLPLPGLLAHPPASAPRRLERQAPGGQAAAPAEAGGRRAGRGRGEQRGALGPGQRGASPHRGVPGGGGGGAAPRASPQQSRSPTTPRAYGLTGGEAAGRAQARALPLTCARQGLAPSRPLPQSSCRSRTPGSPRRRQLPRASSR